MRSGAGAEKKELWRKEIGKVLLGKNEGAEDEETIRRLRELGLDDRPQTDFHFPRWDWLHSDFEGEQVNLAELANSLNWQSERNFWRLQFSDLVRRAFGLSSVALEVFVWHYDHLSWTLHTFCQRKQHRMERLLLLKNV